MAKQTVGLTRCRMLVPVARIEKISAGFVGSEKATVVPGIWLLPNGGMQHAQMLEVAVEVVMWTLALAE